MIGLALRKTPATSANAVQTETHKQNGFVFAAAVCRALQAGEGIRL